MSRLKAVILAAGAGTRMVSDQPKVLHKIIDQSMLSNVIDAAKEALAGDICVVIGHKGEMVKQALGDTVHYVEQKEQLGTGHAVMQAEEFIGDEGQVLILFGDTPLISGKTLRKMVEVHQENQHVVTLLSTKLDCPDGYGRIVRDQNGSFVKSVEHKDATSEERENNEINSGMYLFEASALKEALHLITPNNSQNEYYLPDTLISIMEKNLKVDSLIIEESTEILGVNSRIQLAEATKIMQARICKSLMISGVTIINPEQVMIGKNVEIGMDSIIYPGAVLEGKSIIGKNCIIGLNTRIESSIIDDSTEIESSTIVKSKVGKNCHVGPYAYLRPQSSIGDNVKIGDFVEIKNATIGAGTKVSHLTYIGDADVGEKVNFGCGTVVVNYDGVHKHRTTIKDRAFIGCNTNLISPVVVEENAYTAAGSTINKDVPAYALAIARAPQVNKENWVKSRKTK